MAALADAKANPDRFDMGVFWGGMSDFIKDSPDMTVPPCGTTGCFAGFAALRAAPAGTKIAMFTAHGSKVVLPGQDTRDALTTPRYAAKALEITEDQASTLFHLDDIGEVEAAVHALAACPDMDGTDLWAVAWGARYEGAR
jgi:hypothetical protein